MPLPDDATPDRLDPAVRAELRTLPKTLADRVAGHLVATGLLIDEDPRLAHLHAREARRLAGRVASVREAVGTAAYAAGEFGEALAELRTVRRMTDNPGVLPLIADCERALGRPERALALLQHPDARRLDRAARLELLIVASGARRDLGEARAAALMLEVPELRASDVQDWTPRLAYAYADALLDDGRRDEALRWFETAAATDLHDLTDAEERVAQLRADS